MPSLEALCCPTLMIIIIINTSMAHFKKYRYTDKLMIDMAQFNVRPCGLIHLVKNFCTEEFKFTFRF